MTAFLSICSVTKTFEDSGKRVKVLKDVSLGIAEGEIIAVCGRSGVGKSTLLRIVAGLDDPSSGLVSIGGKSPRQNYPKVGFVNQDYSRSLLPWLSAQSNVAITLLSQNLSRTERGQISLKWLHEVGLFSESGKKPWQLSGGMQQRVALARALASSPILLCLDEPFASLDPLAREELQDLVLSIAKRNKVTTVLVTHDVEEAIYMSDRVFLLDHKSKEIDEFEVLLPWPRNQMTTREDPKFASLKARLLTLLRA